MTYIIWNYEVPHWYNIARQDSPRGHLPCGRICVVVLSAVAYKSFSIWQGLAFLCYHLSSPKTMSERLTKDVEGAEAWIGGKR
jgi:hypothetical protein